ncbi:MAG: lipoprotein signal peptidase [Actinobacteria bacterium]|nr:lipoprotein signal peptidase [Actinomycetota bacterium]
MWLTAWTIWLFDFASKQWAISNLSATPKEVVGSLLRFTLVRNSGAAFSFATGFTIIFSLLAIAVIVTIIRFASVITSQGWLVTAGLLLGGVLGNLTDRIFRTPGFLTGHVIDWIELPHWPIFNIADIAIFSAATTAFVLSVRNIPPTTAVR